MQVNFFVLISVVLFFPWVYLSFHLAYLKPTVRFFFRLPLLGWILFQSAVGRQAHHPITHALLCACFISVHLSWPGISSVVVGIPASILVVQLQHCQFVLQIPLWGSYLPFHGYVAFECIVGLCLAQAFHLFPPADFSVVLTWAAMKGGWGSVLEVSLLLLHSRLMRPCWLFSCVCAPLGIILFHGIHGTSLQCLVRWLCSQWKWYLKVEVQWIPGDLLHLWVSVSKW